MEYIVKRKTLLTNIKHHINHRIKYRTKITNDKITIVFINNTSLTVDLVEPFDEVKKMIDRLINGNWSYDECAICSNSFYSAISCSECFNLMCHTCFDSILETNEGLFTCPWCRKQPLEVRIIGNSFKIDINKLN